jgi:hypothetical protein
MKRVIVLLSLLALAAPLRGAGDGEVVRGPTYEGVIFTPEMLPKSTKRDPDPIVVGGIWPAKATYWTPSARQVRQVEEAFAAAVRKAWKKLPPPGTHDRDFAALKIGSRDWRKPLPVDFDTNFLYGIEPSWLTPKLKRQYIGVTASGRRMLVMNTVYDEEFADPGEMAFMGLDHWRRDWIYMCDAGQQVFYDLKTGELWEVDL